MMMVMTGSNTAGQTRANDQKIKELTSFRKKKKHLDLKKGEEREKMQEKNGLNDFGWCTKKLTLLKTKYLIIFFARNKFN